MIDRPIGVPNDRFELWKENVEKRMDFLQGQEPSSREDMVAEIRRAEEEYNAMKLAALMPTAKDKKLTLKHGQKR